MPGTDARVLICSIRPADSKLNLWTEARGYDYTSGGRLYCVPRTVCMIESLWKRCTCMCIVSSVPHIAFLDRADSGNGYKDEENISVGHSVSKSRHTTYLRLYTFLYCRRDSIVDIREFGNLRLHFKQTKFRMGCSELFITCRWNDSVNDTVNVVLSLGSLGDL